MTQQPTPKTDPAEMMGIEGYTEAFKSPRDWQARMKGNAWLNYTEPSDDPLDIKGWIVASHLALTHPDTQWRRKPMPKPAPTPTQAELSAALRGKLEVQEWTTKGEYLATYQVREMLMVRCAALGRWDPCVTSIDDACNVWFSDACANGRLDRDWRIVRRDPTPVDIDPPDGVSTLTRYSTCVTKIWSLFDENPLPDLPVQRWVDRLEAIVDRGLLVTKPTVDPPAEMDAERARVWLRGGTNRRVVDKRGDFWGRPMASEILPANVEPFTPLAPLTRGQFAEVERLMKRVNEMVECHQQDKQIIASLSISKAELQTKYDDACVKGTRELRDMTDSRDAALAALEQERANALALRMSLTECKNALCVIGKWDSNILETARRVLRETAAGKESGG